MNILLNKPDYIAEVATSGELVVRERRRWWRVAATFMGATALVIPVLVAAAAIVSEIRHGPDVVGVVFLVGIGGALVLADAMMWWVLACAIMGRSVHICAITKVLHVRRRGWMSKHFDLGDATSVDLILDSMKNTHACYLCVSMERMRRSVLIVGIGGSESAESYAEQLMELARVVSSFIDRPIEKSWRPRLNLFGLRRGRERVRIE